METTSNLFKIFMVILLLVSLNSFSQNNIATNKFQIASTIEQVDKNDTIEDFTTYLLMVSFIENEALNYRKALRASKKNSIMITIDSSLTISSTDLLKTFKRASKKAHNLQAFQGILLAQIPNLESSLTYDQLEKLYASFRASTFNGYLDQLRLSFGTSY